MRNFYTEIRKNKRHKIWLFLVILFLLMLLLKLFPPNLTGFPILNKIVTLLGGELFTTLIPLVTFGLFYQIYTENESREISRKDIIDSVTMDKESLALFTKEAKIAFIKSIVCSVIGDRYGQLLFHNLVQVYLKDDVLYRKDFKYDVVIAESRTDFAFNNAETLPASQYYQLTQSIVYAKHFNKTIKDIDFKIVFAFDDKSLDYWMNDEFVFFREVLDIAEWEDEISTYTPADFTEFLQKCLDFNLHFLNDANEPIQNRFIYSVKYINQENAKGLEIYLTDKKALKKVLSTDDSSIYYNCKLSFKMPFSKKKNRFHFVLPEPTINPNFTIRFDANFQKLDYFSYLSVASKKLKVVYDKNVSTYSISATEIIYPRSGAIFFWQN